MECVVRHDACPICSAAIARWRDKATAHGRFSIDRCASCGFAFVNPRPSAETLADFCRRCGQGDTEVAGLRDVLRREARYPNSTRDAERIISTIRRLLDAPGTLLDVGCGYGFFIEEAMRSGFAVTAIEIAPGETTIPRQLTGVAPLNVSFEEYRTRDRFDAVLLSQVIEHAHDVNRWVEKAAALLRPGGVLAVALPNFDSLMRRILGARDPFVTPPVHLNFFAYRNLRLVLRRYGLTVVRHHTFSRFPPCALASRPRRWRFAANLLYSLASFIPRCLDDTSLASMLHVYARKPT